MLKRFGTIFIFLICTNLVGFANKPDSFPDGFVPTTLKDSVDYYLIISERIIDSLPFNSAQKAMYALNLAKELGMKEQQFLASKIIGQANLKLQDYYIAQKYLKSANSFYKHSKDKLLYAECQYNLGLINYHLVKPNEALQYFATALSYYSLQQKQQECADIYQNMGLTYNLVGRYQEASENFQNSLTINTQLENHSNIAALYQNMGIMHYNNGYDSLALNYYYKSIDHYKQQHDLQGIGNAYSNIGLILLKKGEPKAAHKNFAKSYTYFLKTSYELGQMWALNNIGSSQATMGNYIDAENNFSRSLQLARRLNNNEGILTNLDDLAKFHEQHKHYNIALNLRKELATLKDSIQTLSSVNKIQQLEELYSNESRERENILQVSEAKRKRTHQYAIVSIISVLLLSIILILSAYYQKRNAEHNLVEHRSNLEELVEKRTKELQRQINERKTAEESDKLKSAFLANMSHELRTPMNAIIAFSNFLREPELDSEKRIEYLDHITTAGDSLLRLIDDIIDIAKMESRQLKMFIQPSNINRLMQELYRLFMELRLKNNKKHIQFKFTNSSEYNYIINTDNQRLKQVLTNLIENAFKYTEKGKVEFGFEPMDTEMLFYVKDTGVGIPEDKHEIIFNRFYQISSLQDRKGGGTGLGLAISKNLIKLLKGKIWVESELGKGSTFYFKIPVESIKKQLNPSRDKKRKLLKADYNWNNITILVAEDEDLNYKVLDTCLTGTRAHIIRAKDGASAVEICKNQKVDLVLMDIQMPGMDGYKATHEIKKMNNRTPVIAQTSFAMSEEKEKCLQAGCDDFVSKPLNIDSLLKKIEYYIR